MIEKLGRVGNIFAPVTSDSRQCDLETMAVRNWEGEEEEGWMMGMKMITTTSMPGEKKKRKKSLLDHHQKEKIICNHHYQYCGQLVLITRVPGLNVERH